MRPRVGEAAADGVVLAGEKALQDARAVESGEALTAPLSLGRLRSTPVS
ncbi:MAG: hypothetical protein ACREND_01335 [Gemmatimonadaceae bacterium]|jgi:hypothetical protein